MESTPSRKSVSEELAEIFETDQAERVVGFDNIDFERMRENDKARLARAREIYEQIKNREVVLNGEELWKLGMLFQHSPETEDYLTAVEIATMSAQMGNESGAWLSAAAEDRYLLAIGEKQKWGTQFIKNEQGEWIQSPLQSDEESGITDVLRAEKHVPPRAEQLGIFLKRDDI